MFSATMPRAIADLAAQMLRDPVNVAVDAGRLDGRAHRAARHPGRPRRKPAILIDVLRNETVDRALIFTRTKHGADKVVRGLVQSGIAADAIHGNKSQSQRERVLAAFRDRQGQDPRRHRYRRARHRRRRHQPRHQFRLAERGGDLRASHRQNRTRRRGRCRHLAVRRRRDGVHSRHRKADPHADPVNRPADGAAPVRRIEHEDRQRPSPVRSAGKAAAAPSRWRRRSATSSSTITIIREHRQRDGTVGFMQRHAPSGRDAGHEARSAAHSKGS